jgi:hypothetical protein
MQKLTGISSGQNNKSCSIIQHESNKISFVFFRFFCDSLRNLQESGNHFYYWSSPFAAGTLERFWVSQCGPWARWPARAGQIWAMSRRSPAGEGRGAIYGSLALGFGGWTGTRRLRRWGAPAASGTGRRGWPSRRGGARAVAKVGRRVVEELEEGAGDSIGSGGGWGGGAPVAAFQARWRALACARGSRSSP